MWLMGGDSMSAYTLGRPEDVLDAALDFENTGFTAEAVKLLEACTAPDQLTLCHLAKLKGEAPLEGKMIHCHPNRLDDIAALRNDDWRSLYLLGCLYYDRMNYTAAMTAWEKAEKLNPADAYTKRCMAQACFDHLSQPARALELMKQALELAPDNARILYELLQMEKNLGFSVKDRLHLLETHSELAKMRDDCFLDEIILYTQDEQYEKARELLLSKRFNIYEGGEGKLTRHHGWLYTLMGQKALEAGDAEKALEWLKTGLIYPANYGEGRHYSAQEGNVYYYTGLCHEAMGDAAKAKEAYQEAAGQPSQITEMTFFTALAEAKLGREEDARKTFRSMVEEGEKRQASSHRWGYFGVGMAAPLPSELDIKRMNLIDAHLLMLLGKAGLGQDYQSDLDALKVYDPYNRKLDFFRKLGLVK